MEQQVVVATEDATLARDVNSKALLAVDRQGRDAVRRARRQALELIALRDLIEDMAKKIKEFEELRADIAVIRRALAEQTCR